MFGYFLKASLQKFSNNTSIILQSQLIELAAVIEAELSGMSIKGIVYPKMEILSFITHALMSLQTCKIFFHLRNTN